MANSQASSAPDNGAKAPNWHAPDFGSRPVAVLGGGVLGRRIATSWVAAGYSVTLCDVSDTQRDEAALYVRQNVPKFQERTDRKREPGRYAAVSEIESAVKDAWLVVEALPEKLPVKIETMEIVDQSAPHDAIIGTNSSSYRSSLMLQKVDPRRQYRILNTHYCMPPENLLVELMTCGKTPVEILKFMEERLQDAGMLPAIARKESTGFIFNRLWAAIKRETLLILAEGVSEPEEIDRLFLNKFKDSPLGPCAMMDGIGLDTVAYIEDNYIKERDLNSIGRDWLQKNYIDQGKLGTKSNKGGLCHLGEISKS